MKKYIFAALIAALAISSCVRRPLDYEIQNLDPASALIPVHIIWDYSGIDLTRADSEIDRVHRVSLRFFPTDGGEPFDRYLEEPNITDAMISLPVGDYSVIVFNETIDDEQWWAPAITFSNVDDYDLFAARACVHDPAMLTEHFPFLSPSGDYPVISCGTPRKLSSWSLGDFSVRSRLTATDDENAEMDNALMNVVMRRLSYNVTVKVNAQNVNTARTGYCYLWGLADMVYMASGETGTEEVTSPFTIQHRVYDQTNDKNGAGEAQILSLGRVPVEGDRGYYLSMDVLQTNGQLYRPPTTRAEPALTWNVTGHVTEHPIGEDFDIDIIIDDGIDFPDLGGGGGEDGANMGGGITVNDWVDKEYVIN